MSSLSRWISLLLRISATAPWAFPPGAYFWRLKRLLSLKDAYFWWRPTSRHPCSCRYVARKARQLCLTGYRHGCLRVDHQAGRHPANENARRLADFGISTAFFPKLGWVQSAMSAITGF